jgi:hypothetical protein
MEPTFCPLCEALQGFFTLYLNVPPYRGRQICLVSFRRAFHGSHAADDLQPLEFESLSCFTMGKACSAHWPPLIFKPTPWGNCPWGNGSRIRGGPREQPTASIYEGRLFVWFVLFCFVLFVLMRSTEPGCFRSRSWSLWKALEEEGCMGLVPWGLDLRCKSSWMLNVFFNWNFQRNWNVPLVLLERFWWAGI